VDGLDFWLQQNLVSLGADGRWLVVNKFDGSQNTYDAIRLPGTVSLSPDGSRLLLLDLTHELRLTDTATGTLLAQSKEDVAQAALSADGRRLVTAGPGEAAEVRDTATGAVVVRLPATGQVRWAVLSPDGGHVATTTDDGIVRLWEVASGRELVRLPSRGEVQQAVFSPDGRRLATVYTPEAGPDSPQALAISVWKTSGGRAVADPIEVGQVLFHLAFNPNGHRLVTSGAIAARVWDVETSRPVTPALSHRGEVVRVAFSPDGRRVVTASRDETARVWDAETGQPVSPPLLHGGPVPFAAFSADGRRVVTAGTTGSARVWDTDGGQPLSPPLVHGRPLLDAVFSPDGRQLITAALDGSVRTWNLAPDTRALEDLLGSCRLLHGHQLDPTGVPVPLLADELQAGWQRLAKLSPGDFQVSPDEVAAWHRREAEVALADQDGAAAAAHADQALALTPADPDTWLLRGKAFLQLFQGLPAQVSFAWAEALRTPAARLTHHRREFIACMQKENWPAALDHTAAGLALDEKDAGLWLGKGHIHSNRREYQEALACNKRALEFLPRDAQVWEACAQANAHLGQWNEAAAGFLQLIKLRPDDPQAGLWLARSRLMSGDPNGYRSACADLLARFGNTKNYATANIVAWTCTLAPDAVADPAPLLALAEVALAPTPEDPNTLNTVGGVLFRAGRDEEAVKQLNASLARSQLGFVTAIDQVFLAMAHHRLGHADEARKALAQAVQWLDAEADKQDWDNQVDLRLLRKEAEARLTGKQPRP
jgi:WD40 repeat protein/tetratricopeptide (TPR) repeat protein